MTHSVENSILFRMSLQLESKPYILTGKFVSEICNILKIYVYTFRAYAGDEAGSLYLQRFSKYLQREYMVRSLSSIFRIVRQYMSQAVQVRFQLLQIMRNSHSS